MINFVKSNYMNIVRICTMLVFGFLLLFLRNMDPILSPIIYTEDGVWLGMALSSGWVDAFLNAKEGYFVWGNLFLLWCASELSNLYTGHPLVVLPQSIAFISYTFYAAVATLAYFITRNILSLRVRLLLFVILILMPLGDSTNENIGRISNVGYLAVFLSLLLIFEKTFNKSIEPKDKLIQLGLIFLISINPINMLIVPVLAYYANTGRKFIISFDFISKTVDEYRYVFIFIIFIASLQQVYFGGNAGSSITGKINLTSLVEVGVARSLLYPLVFPIYKYFNDFWTILVFGVIFTILFYLYAGIPKGIKIRKLINMSIISLLIFLFFTIYMRRSLTEQLGGYSTTFPDRYFVGLNVISIFIFILISGSQTVSSRLPAVLKSIAIYVVLILYLLTSLKLFELNNPRMQIMTGENFYESICLTEPDIDGFVKIPTYFSGWKMTVPNSLRDEFIKMYDCKSVVSRREPSFYVSDANWNNGISRAGAGFLIRNNEKNRLRYVPGSVVIFANGENRKIRSVSENSLYLNVWLDGEILDPRLTGLPSTFEVVAND